MCMEEWERGGKRESESKKRLHVCVRGRESEKERDRQTDRQTENSREKEWESTYICV